MTRIVATLTVLALAACGSASKAGPKTSNPPLTPDTTAKKTPDPAEKPAVEQDGLTLKFNQLAFRLTLTPAPWKGNLAREQDGSTRIVLLRPDAEAVLVLIPIHAPGESAKAIADDQHAKASKEPHITTAPVAAEARGRHAFTGDRTDDGVASRTYLAVSPHPSIADAYIVAVAQMKVDAADAFLAEVRAVLDSIAPHP